ncbi:hypothetical protein FB561_2780 [Kribbella amoyensis]|uniref:Uncharacterized protein n=1 Tax=Kribbella amoyensis TaxID=996641 RepID=A0A561BRY1_9ACTN|nr:hypothetical protein [Kribbella amoyensis]TWD81660.1 hypothetical protein FB561_2780 [Kribbella amoyensis]
MPQPTWTEITRQATTCLNQGRAGLSDARDWLASDWHPAHGPTDHDQRHEAARLISQAKALLDQAKNALEASRQ